LEIQGKIAVVTGAASGIGSAVAIALARKGADVVVADLSRDGLVEVLKEVEGAGQRGLAVETDVTKPEAVQNLYELSISEMGRVDILVNNAGVHMAGPVEKTPIGDWQWITDVNLWGVIHGIHFFLPHMLRRGNGHIVNTASIAGLAGGLDGSIPYTMTKFAVVGLSEGLAVYLRQKGIGVTAICPGLVSTNILANQRLIPVGDGLDEARRDFLKALQTRFRAGNPLDPSGSQEETVISPQSIGEGVVHAIEKNRFLVVMPDQVMETIKQRSQDMEGFIDRQSRKREDRERFLKGIFTQMAKEKAFEDPAK
jgi:NAD(P)-dependent dehydrogenase (short-subunit alcohol dehydrogenase family)